MEIFFEKSIEKFVLPIISINFQGHKLLMLVDSGSDRNLICSDIFETLCDKRDVFSECVYYGIDGTEHVTKQILLSFMVDKEKYQAPFVVLGSSNGFDNVEQENGIKINGIIGSEFFKENRWVIDFYRNRIFSAQIFQL